MRLSGVVLNLMLILLSIICTKALGWKFPIDVDRLPFSGQRKIMDGSDDVSCPAHPPLSATDRTEFSASGCTIYGYPSTGGILIKQANILDLIFLNLPRFETSRRSDSAEKEDQFCHLLRRIGATFWPSKRFWIHAQMGAEEATEEQQKVMVYGWPADGSGVWVLRYANERQLPKDFGRIEFAMNMEEKIQLMKHYDATFEDPSQVQELLDD